MIKSWDEVQSYIFFMSFALFAFVFIAILILLSRKKNNKLSRNLYGYFNKLNTKSIYALSLLFVNFFLLSFLLIMKINLNYFYIGISILLIVIAFILNNNAFSLIINTFINLINIAIVYLGSLVNVLRIDNNAPVFYILQIFMNVLGLLFFIFTTMKFMKNLNRKDKIDEKNN